MVKGFGPQHEKEGRRIQDQGALDLDLGLHVSGFWHADVEGSLLQGFLQSCSPDSRGARR